VPTLKTEAYFPAPSRLGELLQFSLRVAKMGTSSVDLDIQAECNGEVRVEAKLMLVHISNTTGKSKSWPDDMRGPMLNYISK
jgi:4-hydroxybenzoyl-CoA thioesterase